MISVTVVLAVLASLSSVSASCGHGLPWIHPFEPSVRGTVAIPPFDYGLTTGPLNWHNLNNTYFLCGNGTNQSPILLNSTSNTAPEGSINLSIPPAHNVVFENQGTNVEVIMNGTAEVAGKTYNLTQFHFHTSSEHRVDLRHYDGEMHFVFAATDGSHETVVLGYFITAAAGETTPVLETIFSHLDEIQVPGTTTEVAAVDLTDFQKQANLLAYFQYKGSLTTPPCSEGVLWNVATTPIPLDVGTYLKLKNTTKTNNRFTQNNIGDENILVIAGRGLQ